MPFGLSTEYDEGWVGRYHAIKSAVPTINLNPALAFKLNDQLSLGAGMSAQYISAELTSAIDSGSVCYGLVGPGTCNPAGLTPGSQAVDSYAKIKGDDWGYGINLGLLYKPANAMRIGVAYRSSVKQRLEGDATLLSFDVGYAHLFVKDSTINNTTESSIANNLQGDYANKVDMLSAQLNYKF